MKDLSIFIPLHTFNSDIEDSLKNAIESVTNQDKNIDIFISIPEEFHKEFSGIKKFNTKHIITIKLEKDMPLDFCSQVNMFAKMCDTKWFSILEFDDAYTKIWFKNAEIYSEANPEASVLLPLNEIHDYKTGNMTSFANEIVWATSFSNEIGYIDLESLEAYSEYSMTGGIFNTTDFLEVGGLKPSIKISFWSEFLLRATHQQKKIFVVPKVGYIHILGREGSLIDEYSKTISEEEAKWWFDLAKGEYFFIEDRKKEYKPNKQEKISDLK